MKVIIKILDAGNESYSEVLIDKKKFIIGRSPQADVVIPHDAVSRKHCEVDVKSRGDIYITDLGGLNGTMINGERIPSGKPTLYPTYLVITIGNIAEIQIREE